MLIQKKTTLTSLVGFTDGFAEGEIDGPFEGDIDGLLLGLLEGDRLGFCVGCKIYKRYTDAKSW